MKICHGCQTMKPASEFYKHKAMGDGRLGYCKDCVRARVAKRYREQRDARSEYERKRAQDPARKEQLAEYRKRMRRRNPDKYKARNALNNAIRDGKIKRGPCEVCGTKVRVQGHHSDYSKPLDVRWLCFRCHREIEHGQTVVRLK